MCASPVLDGYQPLAQCVAHPSSNLFSLQGSGTKLLWQWMNSKPRYFNLNYTYTDAIVNDEDHFKLRGWGGDQSHYNPMFGGFWSLWMNWFFSQKVSEKLELQSGSGVSGAVRFSPQCHGSSFPFFLDNSQALSQSILGKTHGFPWISPLIISKYNGCSLNSLSFWSPPVFSNPQKDREATVSLFW